MTEAPRILRSTQRKKLAVFLDGTWNNVGDDTNVWRLKSLLSPTGTDGAPQLAYYEKGVSGLLGGWFGKGLDDDITDAYLWLIDHYNPDNQDDDIFIFGFSRGAYSARSLAGFIVKCGLLKAGGALGVGQLYNRYRKADARTLRVLLAARDNGTLKDATLEEQWMMKYSMPIHIKFVGVWDTVGELGIPLFSIQGISRSTLRFHSTELMPPVDYGFHALAINENRRAFSPTLWTVLNPSAPDPNADPLRPLPSVEQRWFVGAHANVGGGNDSDVLPQIPLRWLMKKASLHGLTFRADVDLDGDELKAEVTELLPKIHVRPLSPVQPPLFSSDRRPAEAGRKRHRKQRQRDDRRLGLCPLEQPHGLSAAEFGRLGRPSQRRHCKPDRLGTGKRPGPGCAGLGRNPLRSQKGGLTFVFAPGLGPPIEPDNLPPTA